MDATATRLFRELDKARKQRRALDERVDTIKRAMRIAGIDPDRPPSAKPAEDLISLFDYDADSFKNMTLIATIGKILAEHQNEAFTVERIEAIVVRGGYQFATDDPTNSVDVTLRRMAKEKMCTRDRIPGSRSFQYRFRK